MVCLHPEKKVKIWKRSKEKSSGEDSAENGTSLMKMEDNVKKRPHSDSMTSDVDGPCMMSLLPLPNLEECNSGPPVILTGTACKGVTGPPVGVVDIGVSISAYYFRIALPGVKKDPGRIFQGNTEYLNICITYPFTCKTEHVVQTGEAREGRAGDPNDTVTITITAISYKFKVVLPAVASSLDNLSVDVLPNGNVEVEGIVRAGEITSSVVPTVCNRRTQQIFPQGHFTINFTLPGPAYLMFVRAKLNSNGVLKGTAFKRWIARSRYIDDLPESSD